MFRIRIEDTVAWLLREMRVDGGAFAASLDADSDGEEGLFYTWSRQEIEAVLGDDFSLVFQILHALRAAWLGRQADCPSDRTRSRAKACPTAKLLIPLKAKLLATREQRVRPGRDGKALTDWNGLMIAALAEAGRSLDRPDWIDAAAKAFAHIADAAHDGRLPHSMLGAKKLFPALSSDYAAMANAAIALFEATGDSAYIDQARQFIEQLDHWHPDGDGTGYYLTASDSTDVPIRIRGDVDEAISSATSQIIEALVRLASVTGDLDLQDKAWRVAEHAMGRAGHQSYGQAGIVNACALALEPLKLVLVDSPDKSKPRSGCESESRPAPGGYRRRDRNGSKSTDIAGWHPAANRQTRRLAVYRPGLSAGGDGSAGTRAALAPPVAQPVLPSKAEEGGVASMAGACGLNSRSLAAITAPTVIRMQATRHRPVETRQSRPAEARSPRTAARHRTGRRGS